MPLFVSVTTCEVLVESIAWLNKVKLLVERLTVKSRHKQAMVNAFFL